MGAQPFDRPGVVVSTVGLHRSDPATSTLVLAYAWAADGARE